MKEEIFNQDYAHLTLLDLKEDLIRLENKHKERNFQSEEINNIEIEIKLREEYLKQPKEDLRR